MTIQFIAGADSTTTTPTINVNSAGAKTIVDEAGNALVAGDIATGDLYEIVYDGTNFRLKFNGSSVGTAASRDVGVSAGNLPTVDQAVTATASATTTTLGTTLKHGITGTTTITAFNGVAGVTYHCRADGAFTLTHDATDLDILQTGSDITTSADDTFDVYMRTATTCEIRNYQRASGEALAPSGGITIGTPVSASGTAVDFTSIPSGTKRITVSFSGVSTNATSLYRIQIGDSGGIETSGYGGASFRPTSTFNIFSSGYDRDWETDCDSLCA
jgi:hypothetical protein